MAKITKNCEIQNTLLHKHIDTDTLNWITNMLQSNRELNLFDFMQIPLKRRFALLLWKKYLNQLNFIVPKIVFLCGFLKARYIFSKWNTFNALKESNYLKPMWFERYDWKQTHFNYSYQINNSKKYINHILFFDLSLLDSLKACSYEVQIHIHIKKAKENTHIIIIFRLRSILVQTHITSTICIFCLITHHEGSNLCSYLYSVFKRLVTRKKGKKEINLVEYNGHYLNMKATQ